jgi:hypothetical protein
MIAHNKSKAGPSREPPAPKAGKPAKALPKKPQVFRSWSDKAPLGDEGDQSAFIEEEEEQVIEEDPIESYDQPPRVTVELPSRPVSSSKGKESAHISSDDDDVQEIRPGDDDSAQACYKQLVLLRKKVQPLVTYHFINCVLTRYYSSQRNVM